MIRLLFLLVAPFAMTACATAPSEPLAVAGETAPKDAPREKVTLPDDADPAIWVVADDDTTIYLFGTVHILKPGLTWFDEAVADAFTESDELVVEMIEPDVADMGRIVAEMAIDRTGVPLREKLEPEDRARYEAALAKLGVAPAQFDPLEPWFASLSLSILPLTQGGYETDSGAEKSLLSLAKARGLDIVGLETPREQLGFFDTLPEATQIRFLNANVASLDKMAAGMDDMVAYWARGEVDRLAELMNAALDDREVYEALLTRRNANWADWIDARLDAPGTVFVAVGAGHLAGAESLQAMLAKRGLAARRIEY